ncbi:MAG: hypothetical protein GY696_12745, partial [Gammaproteobacteria bacterium]|nr:hypothetical protein [Gammaproteobacteria bacterium]
GSRSLLPVYADDTALLFHIRKAEDFIQAQIAVNLIEDWFEQNDLTLNETKTDAILFAYGNSCSNTIEMKVRGKAIQYSKTVKYLGVQLDPTLSFSEHVQQLAKSCRRTAGALSKLHGKYVPRDCLLKIYKQVIRPKIDYAAVIYDPRFQKDRKTIEKVQKFALRLIHRDWTSSYDELMDRSATNRLSCRRVQQKLVWLRKFTFGVSKLPPGTLPLSNYTPASQSWALRSAQKQNHHQHTLLLPKCNRESYRSSFAFSAASAWNSLSLTTCNANLPRFKTLLYLQ